MQNENTVLASRFHEYFKIGLAQTQADLEKTYRIRYRVYCDEFSYLPAEDYPDGLESDEYDSFSSTCLITHRLTNMPAACVRLVPAINGSGSEYPLPYELLRPNVLDEDFHRQLDVPRDKIAEISRLAVDGAFRRRTGEAETRFGEIDALDIDSMEKRTFGLISVAAFLASCAMGELHKFSAGFAMMEPFLPRLMQRSGIHFTKVGTDIDYHGLRAPYYVELGSVLESMRPDLRLFYKSVYQAISVDFGAQSTPTASLRAGT
ncbi:PEP-CTERM/exosortase system-associated acyltransferase [Haliea sp. E1-2-M8]|uniref:PEP-CTERM/exosortase system-associated acyltransferase n=1 Tax=Haliea sp. E1-2-M8 TaxID=3064706 RepID=UPI00272796C0|nr:PEP-CTERM/exosortase system-associated acyltransferase [Haliea sp. E1-2-M8]MDO8863758.1 PEP-CTERM/exosortase system-associated acyltransferase [Haliea sp. E1-2-M8]